MTAVAFDTLAYAKRLQEAGMEAKLAEAQAVALAEALQGSIAELATKHDIADLRSEMKVLEAGIKAEFVAIRTDLRWLRWLVVTVGVSSLVILARLFLFWPGAPP